MHSASTGLDTHYHIYAKRGLHGMVGAGILESFLGTLVHGCWGGLFRYGRIPPGNVEANAKPACFDLTFDKERLKKQGIARAMIAEELVAPKNGFRRIAGTKVT